MAVSATRELLGVTSSLFDHSNVLNEQTRKLARHIETRRATADMAEMRAVIQGGVDGSALAALSSSPHLAAALEACSQTATHIQQLQEARSEVMSARREVMSSKDESILKERASTSAESEEATRAIDEAYLKRLKERAAAIKAATGGDVAAAAPAAAAPAPAAEAAPAEPEAAAEAASSS